MDVSVFGGNGLFLVAGLMAGEEEMEGASISSLMKT